eukprot:gene4447-4494_t
MLQAIGLLEGGFEGRIEIAGIDASALSGDARTALRRSHLGFVYQFHHLLPDFTATENVMLAGLIAGHAKAEATARATAERVFDELVHLVRGQGSAALIATHNERLAFRMDRVLRLHEGVLE